MTDNPYDRIEITFTRQELEQLRIASSLAVDQGIYFCNDGTPSGIVGEIAEDSRSAIEAANRAQAKINVALARRS